MIKNGMYLCDISRSVFQLVKMEMSFRVEKGRKYIYSCGLLWGAE